MTRKTYQAVALDEQARLERKRLVASLLKINPWGGYCVAECNHLGHTNEKYRDTLRRYGVSV